MVKDVGSGGRRDQKERLDESEKSPGVRNKEMFLTFLSGMLERRPEYQKNAAELLKGPWLNR